MKELVKGKSVAGVISAFALSFCFCRYRSMGDSVPDSQILLRFVNKSYRHFCSDIL